MGVTGEELPAFRRGLLAWYDKHRRDLPWRKSRDPYRIWISEIMLQQTRVAAVLEHYRFFLKRFPNIRAVAAASESDVLAAWSGLGYYRRARMLHQCAQKIVSEHAGRFPRTSEQLGFLPGIGRYTAAAIASIAFGEPAAVVDGNVERVLARLVNRSVSVKDAWQGARQLLNVVRPGDHNQAMMELGATICLPRQPRCEICPARKWCAAQGEIRGTPVSMKRGSPSKHRTVETSASSSRQIKKEVWYALERRDSHVRLVRRPAGASVMAGMWELPRLPKVPRRITDATRWRTFRHSITVTDYTVNVSRHNAGRLQRGKWIAIADIPRLPITGLTRKILKADGII